MARKEYVVNQTAAQVAETAANLEQAAGKAQAEQEFALTITGGGIAATAGQSLFSKVDKKKAEKKSLPPMVLPGQIPVGAEMAMEIVDAVDSPVTTVKGKLLSVRAIAPGHPSDGTEYCFPATGVVRSFLVGSDAKDDDKDTLPKLQKLRGKVLIAKKLPGKSNKKGGRDVHMFDLMLFADRAAFDKAVAGK